jgi:hypothetical protein
MKPTQGARRRNHLRVVTSELSDATDTERVSATTNMEGITIFIS